MSYLGENFTNKPFGVIIKQKHGITNELIWKEPDKHGVGASEGGELFKYLSPDGKTRYCYEQWVSYIDDVSFHSLIFDSKPTKKDIHDILKIDSNSHEDLWEEARERNRRDRQNSLIPHKWTDDEFLHSFTSSSVEREKLRKRINEKNNFPMVIENSPRKKQSTSKRPKKVVRKSHSSKRG